ncbi:hypothetical protein [Buttiauxella gaviniae]|uniref:hypothetical protein n=1 Tax=Buttiauxella gaviniae TaxID=82990 RepID=UPI003C74967B
MSIKKCHNADLCLIAPKVPFEPNSCGVRTIYVMNPTCIRIMEPYLKDSGITSNRIKSSFQGAITLGIRKGNR